jgi:KaiC/GvpD/RAD55 family RecA-like ATPase
LALDPVATRWFESRRGIKKTTVEAFGVYTERRDLVFPYPGGLKKRRYSVEEDNPFGLEKEGRRFTWEDETGGPAGAGQVPYLPPDFERGSHMILVEGETDTMALWQSAPPEARRQVIGLSGTGSFEKSGAAELLADAKIVFVIFDNDDPYQSKDAYDSTERAWQTVRKRLGAKARRVTLPQGVNDVAEFFEKYGWPAFRVLLDKALEVHYPFNRLDLSGPLPEFDWLVPGLFAQGDIVLGAGDPGVGKSWLFLALAVAIANGDETFLGMPLGRAGRVLYIDQENPMVTARQRLAKLGITEAGQKNMHYLWYQGVKLDTEPERLYEHVELWQPELVVVDSLSRVHFKNENAQEDMNPLLNGGVYPLSRELGATVVLIHHLSKVGMSRGSTAIPAAVDLEIGIQNETLKSGGETGRKVILPNKLRNVPEWGHALRFRLTDTEDGRVTLTASSDEEAY